MKTWIRVARSDDVIVSGGGCVKLGGVQIALFKAPQFKAPQFKVPDGASHTQGHTWYAVQNLHPHDSRQVLSRGLTDDVKGEPKVACPLHKNNVSLSTGEHLAGASSKPAWRLETFPVKEEGGAVFIGFDAARLTPPPEAARESGQAAYQTHRHGRAN